MRVSVVDSILDIEKKTCDRAVQRDIIRQRQSTHSTTYVWVGANTSPPNKDTSMCTQFIIVGGDQ